MSIANFLTLLQAACYGWLLVDVASAENGAEDAAPEMLVTTSLPTEVSKAKGAELDAEIPPVKLKANRLTLSVVLKTGTASSFRLNLIESPQRAVIRCEVVDSKGLKLTNECVVSNQIGRQIEMAFQSYCYLDSLNRIEDDLREHTVHDTFAYVKTSRSEWVEIGDGYINSWSRKIVNVTNMMLDCCAQGGAVTIPVDIQNQILELGKIFDRHGVANYRLRRNRDYYVFLNNDIKGMTDVTELLNPDGVSSRMQMFTAGSATPSK